MSPSDLDIIRKEITDAVTQALTIDREKTLIDFYKRIKNNLVPDGKYISQNKASKIIGRGRLERAMADGIVRWSKEDLSNPHCPVRVNYDDLMKMKSKL